MPRRPRVDMVGSYHVLNRGVDRMVIYKDSEDYCRFLMIVCDASKLFDVNIHSYALMSNHYHLLIETKRENLSKFMKHINAMYAIYFNKKNKRSGYLWQGRYKSWFVTDESYLYALIKYIENNPLKAKIVKQLSDYKYSSYNSFIKNVEPIECLKQSIMFEQFKSNNDVKEFFQTDTDENILKEMKKNSNSVITSIKKEKSDLKKLKEVFKKEKLRDSAIYNAYLEDFSQTQIAKFLNMSQANVSKIIKRMRNKL